MWLRKSLQFNDDVVWMTMRTFVEGASWQTKALRTSYKRCDFQMRNVGHMTHLPFSISVNDRCTDHMFL